MERYVVLLEDSVEHPGAVGRAQVKQRDGRLGFVYRHALKGYSAWLPEAAIAGLRADPRVARVAVDHRVETFAQNVPTGMQRSFASGNETLDIDSEDDVRVDVDIAVIDTGVDFDHPDLEVVARTDCSEGTEEEAECADDSGDDVAGHGTHVAGTAAAIDNNFGVAGVAPGARVWAVKVLDEEGHGFDSWIAAGVDWVTAHAAEIEVANMSLGCQCESPATEAAIEGSIDAGVVYAVAAGNSDADVSEFSPANQPDVITVSALADFDGQAGATGESGCGDYFQSIWGAQEDDALAKFSNWGSGVDVAAPGVCIRSTVPGGTYAEDGWWGTSMASPHVAGAAAVLASQADPESQEDVEAIRDAIVEAGNLEWEDTSGDGEQEPLLDLSDEEVFSAAPQEDGEEAPDATTGAATGVTGSRATLHGTVDPNGSKTTYQFEYGLSEEYGSKAPASAKTAGLGTKGIPVGAAVEGLEAEATYHFRVVATNASGTDYGADETFTTESATSEWVVESSPNKSEAEGNEQILGDVGCYSEDLCMAVGAYVEGEEKTPFAMYWDGEKWSVTPLVGKAEMNDVACISSTKCLAVGREGSLAKAARWVKGVGWLPTKLPEVFTNGSRLNALSCMGSAPQECIAVGEYKDANKKTRPLAMRWLGTPEEWVQVGVPTPGEEAALAGVYCRSNTSCEVVGYQVKSEAQYPLAMRLNGLSWSLQGLPDVEAEGESTHLKDIACIEEEPTQLCLAVGSNEGAEVAQTGIAMLWDGAEWQEQSLGAPEEGTVAALENVSCGSSGRCGASGYATVEESIVPLAEMWSEAGWVAEDTADPSEGEGAFLLGVACNYGPACLAVGAYPGAEAVLSLVERRQPAEPEGPTAPTATTEAATGVSTSKATLHGTVNPNGAETTYQFEYGTTESYGSKAPASPKGIGAGTSGVAVEETIEGLAASTTYHFRVVATNSKGTTYGKDKTFTTEAEPKAPTATTEAATGVTTSKATLNGTVNPNGASTTYQFEYGTTESYGSKIPASPQGIGSGTSNVAVDDTVEGLAAETTYHFRVVATNSKGTTYGGDKTFTTQEEEVEPEWSIEATPNPSEAEGSEQRFGDVSCPSTTLCLAVGAYSNGEGSGALAERWNGTEWSILSTPSGFQMNDIHCLGSGECAAVGSKEEGIWAERWTAAGGWATMSVPTVEGTSSVLNGGHCAPGTLVCLTVGSRTVSGEERALAMRWNVPFQKWDLQTTPTKGEHSVLTAVSCNTSTSCFAVGYYLESSNRRPLAMHWNGTTWSLQTVPNTQGEGSDTYLNDVSCRGTGEAARCVAVGVNEGAEVARSAVAKHWNGTEWTEAAPKAPGGAKGDVRLDGVSCASATECFAVGEYVSAAEDAESKTLAEKWNGSEWSISPSPNREGHSWNGLRGVSCAPELKCLAVGSSENASRTDTLAMRQK